MVVVAVGVEVAVAVEEAGGHEAARSHVCITRNAGGAV